MLAAGIEPAEQAGASPVPSSACTREPAFSCGFASERHRLVPPRPVQFRLRLRATRNVSGPRTRLASVPAHRVTGPRDEASLAPEWLAVWLHRRRGFISVFAPPTLESGPRPHPSGSSLASTVEVLKGTGPPTSGNPRPTAGARWLAYCLAPRRCRPLACQSPTGSDRIVATDGS